MQIKIDKSTIENVITHLINFVEKKDNSSITSHIYIEVNDSITLKATDNETGLEIKNVSGTIIEKGNFTINGKNFFDIIKVLKDEPIEIKKNDDDIIIQQQHSKYKLPTFNYKDFPEFPTNNNMSKIELNSLTFLESLKKVLPVIDVGNQKYEFNGALIDILEDKINIVSTDTKRLAICEFDNSSQDKNSIIIPKKAINIITKLFFNNIEIYCDNVNLIIKSNNTLFFTKLINGKFPNYQRIIPQSFNIKLDLNKNKFLKAMKQITIISENIKINIDKNILTINSISTDGSAQTELELNGNYDNYTFAVNSKFIYDFIQSIDNDEFQLLLNEPQMAFTLKDENFSTIVMPLAL